MARILTEVFTVFSRYPIEIIFTLEEFEITGRQINDLPGIQWDYDGENELELIKPGKITFKN